MKKALEPLIPLEAFGKLVARIARVPKSEIDKMEKNRPKRKRDTEKKL